MESYASTIFYMRRLRRLSSAKIYLAVLYGLAMLLLPLAHRPLAPAEADLSAYALPDGTLPIICWSGAGQSNQPTSAKRICDACLLTAAPGLFPSLIVQAMPASRVIIVVSPSRQAPVRVFSANAAAYPRAPPASSYAS